MTAPNGDSAAVPPAQRQKFDAAVARSLLGEVLRSELTNTKYEADEVAQLGKRVGETINRRLSGEMALEQYKYVTSVSIFQNSGQGARMGTSAIWDPDADAVVQDMFVSDSIKCVAVVFAVCVY
ncbi:Tctex1 domain-containing protein 2 [Coemansia sp. RSA 1200]|nr:Tctex1 domain-containing protein 2 [Coemansia sp. RSA 1200]